LIETAYHGGKRDFFSKVAVSFMAYLPHAAYATFNGIELDAVGVEDGIALFNGGVFLFAGFRPPRCVKKRGLLYGCTTTR
jgi:hypothetical protein